MRVVQIANPDPGKPPLEFHPKLTVITGLAPDDQLQLVTALQALLTAQPIDLETVVAVGDTEIAVHGVAPVPPGAEDAVPVLGEESFLTPVIKTDEAARRALAAEVEAAGEASIEAKLFRSELSDAFEAANHRLDRNAVRSLADVAAGVADLESQLALAPGQGALGAVDRLRERRDRLSELGKEFHARTAWFSAEGSQVMRDVLGAIRDATITTESPSLVAEALADDWSRARARFDDADLRLRTTYGDVDQLQTRLSVARRNYQAVSEKSSAKPKVSPADIAMLEDAHDRVVEAEARVTGRASIYLPELIVARRAEQRILDRLGFATWAEFMLEGAFDSTNAGAGRDVAQARREYQDAQRKWEALNSQLESDEELAAAAAELDAIAERAAEMVGEVPDLEAALRSHRIRPAEVADQLPEARERLAEVLEILGFEDLDKLNAEELTRLAVDWQTAAKNQQATVADLEAAGRSVEAEIARIDQTLSLADSGETLSESDPRIDLMISILEAAEASFDRHMRATIDLSRATEQIDILELQIERLRVMVRVKTDQLDKAEKPSEWVAVDAVQAAGLVRSHYDALREGTSSPLPAVLDRPLGVLDIAAQTAVLVEFLELSDGVQTIWFNPDRLITDWASSLGDAATVLRFTDAST